MKRFSRTASEVKRKAIGKLTPLVLLMSQSVNLMSASHRSVFLHVIRVKNNSISREEAKGQEVMCIYNNLALFHRNQ